VYTVYAGELAKLDLWHDQAEVSDADNLRLRVTKQGKKAQIQQYVYPEIGFFSGGVLLIFEVLPVTIPQINGNQLGGITELGHWNLYVETSQATGEWVIRHTNQLHIVQRGVPADFVVDGGPALEQPRGVIDGGSA
jgi:hypothetical protein